MRGVLRRWWLLSSVLCVVLAAGCTQEVTGRPAAGFGTPGAAGAGAGLDAFAGTWEGTYTCPMGPTGMRLIIDAPQGDSVRAVFEFFPLPENPTVPPGSYRMTGRREGAVVAFRGGDWIVQPPGYVTVDLLVPEPPTGAMFSGIVDEPGCTLFEVSRL